MCGLVAMIARTGSGFYQKDVSILEAMLVLDGHYRGMDSTGVYQILRNRQVAMAKIASHSYDLFSSEAWGPMTRRMVSDGRIMVGHNRKATQGAINSENAHPFHEGNIILVHNGTLFNHKSLADTEVDSQAIARSINEKGADETLKLLNGAFALIWYDLQRERLCVVRNKERPLGIVVTESRFILASEPWMATTAIARQGAVKDEVKEIIDIEPGELYEFKLDGTYSTRKVEFRPPVVATVTSYSRDACAVEWDERDDDAFWNRHRPASHGTSGYPDTGRMGGRAQQARDNYNARQRAIAQDRNVPAVLQGRSVDRSNMSDKVVNLFPEVEKFYKIGDEVMIKINSSRAGGLIDGNVERMAFNGVTCHPLKPQVDVTGLLPKMADPSELPSWYNGPCLGRIVSIKYGNCGATLMLEKVKFDDVFETHNGSIGETEWDFVHQNHLCNKCSSTIEEIEVPVTSVTRTGLNLNANYRVTCHKCIEQAIPEGKVRDAFIQRRIDALQDGEPVGTQSVASTVATAGTPSTPTVH